MNVIKEVLDQASLVFQRELNTMESYGPYNGDKPSKVMRALAREYKELGVNVAVIVSKSGARTPVLLREKTVLELLHQVYHWKLRTGSTKPNKNTKAAGRVEANDDFTVVFAKV